MAVPDSKLQAKKARAISLTPISNRALFFRKVALAAIQRGEARRRKKNLGKERTNKK